MKKGVIAGLLIMIAGSVFASAFSRDYYSVDELKGIKAELRYENVVIKNVNDDEVKVDIRCNNERKMPEVSIKDNTLYIKNLKKGTYAENCTVYIYMPENLTSDFIDIATASGDIEVENLKVKDMELKANSGDIDCINLRVKNKLSARAASGDITLKNIDAEEINISVASGDIDLTDITAEDIELGAASGDIEVDNLSVASMICSTASGSQDYDNIDCETFELAAASGSIKISLNQAPEDDSSISTASGSVTLRLPRSAAFQLNLSSSSGRFSDEFEGNSYRPNGKVKSKYNGGGVNINIKTTSGNIDLDD